MFPWVFSMRLATTWRKASTFFSRHLCSSCRDAWARPTARRTVLGDVPQMAAVPPIAAHVPVGGDHAHSLPRRFHWVSSWLEQWSVSTATVSSWGTFWVGTSARGEDLYLAIAGTFFRPPAGT